MSEIKEKVDAIKLVLVAAQMMDYGNRILLGRHEPSLAVCVNKVLSSIKDLENHFIYFPGVHPKYKEIFQREFNRDEMILYSELMQTVYGLNSESLELIINSIKSHMAESI